MLYLLTSGSYSDYGVQGLVDGPPTSLEEWRAMLRVMIEETAFATPPPFQWPFLTKEQNDAMEEYRRGWRKHYESLDLTGHEAADFVKWLVRNRPFRLVEYCEQNIDH
jgi:hypothetical protein